MYFAKRLLVYHLSPTEEMPRLFTNKNLSCPSLSGSLQIILCHFSEMEEKSKRILNHRYNLGQTGSQGYLNELQCLSDICFFLARSCFM